MVEFNPDGSIKLPAGFAREKKDQEDRMRIGRCLLVKKEVVSDRAPKKCMLHVTVSERVASPDVVSRVHSQFTFTAETPTKCARTADREFKIEIGTAFRRCTECTALIGRLKEEMDGNLILDKGNCTFEPYRQDFTEEDYFD